ncbi:endonuclease/exonuclease/phosphatase family protein [Marmoricola sp. RAF53]|uniref:endonuclease/exonuclease/phosphatase family protein n=1 Tax=Marmoricola sp. RAF53 TaxID=3233059 RepID=UPI003F978C61
MLTSGPVRVAAASIAVGALTGSVVLTLMRVTTPSAVWFVAFTALVPLAVLGYALSAVLLLLLRRRSTGGLRRGLGTAAAVAVAGLLFHSLLVAPAFTGAHAALAAGGRPDLSVMTLNLRFGEADAARAVALAREHGVDVLVLEEVTPSARERLRAAGLDALLPHAAGSTSVTASGTMVFSAYPLSGVTRLPVRNGAWRVQVAASEPFTLFAVHTSQPLHGPARWERDWDALDRAVRAQAGPRLVVGDYNATLDHRPVRRLLDAGFADAARTANAGWQPTWPTRQVTKYRSPVGLMAIDHVLHSADFDVASTATAEVDGTDHRALLARIVR